jgi:hypothetical protein
MSIQSVGGAYGHQGILPGARQMDEGRELEAQAGGSAQDAAQEAPSLQGTAGELPAKAPPGTDPNLWSVLTAEERGFFAKAQTMGPLTYNKANGQGAQAALQRGSRIDVRV